ncbi:MAG: PilW family protein [Pseudomonadota bacterium]
MSLRRQFGITLVEIMIALGIGVAITGTIAQALALTSDGYRRTETLAFMQEQADVAIRFLTEDIRMAGHWSLAGSAQNIEGRSIPGNTNPLGLALPRRCHADFVLDLGAPVLVSDTPEIWGCGANAVPLSDAIALRSLAPRVVPADSPRLQVITTPGYGLVQARLDDLSSQHPLSQRHNLSVHGYYVAARSTLFPDQPVLRRMTLSALSSRPYVLDEEIAQGIETLQIVVLVDSDADGAADMTLEPGDPRLDRRRENGISELVVLGVRFWLVVRSETGGWSNGQVRALAMGRQSYLPPDDGRLRFVASQTVWVRNASPNL